VAACYKPFTLVAACYKPFTLDTPVVAVFNIRSALMLNTYGTGKPLMTAKQTSWMCPWL